VNFAIAVRRRTAHFIRWQKPLGCEMIRARRVSLAAGMVAAVMIAAVAAQGENPSRAMGPLILDGGGVSSSVIFDRIVAEVPVNGTLCLIDTAMQGQGEPERLFDGYPDLNVDVMAIDDKSAKKKATAGALRGCGGFFFNGGDPQALSRAFTAKGKGTPALAAVREQVEQKGIMFSGSSAGAMIVGDVTLCECGAKSSVEALTKGELFQAPGFGLVDGILIDAHFFTRGLLGRHLYALATNNIPIGVGIDESTAIVVPRGGGPWEVVGDSTVALIYAPRDAQSGQLHGFTLSLLSPGDVFDPHTGTVTVAAERRPLNVERDESDSLLFQDPFAPGRVRAMIERLAQSGAVEATAAARGAKVRLVVRKTSRTKSYSDGRTFTVIALEVSIEQPQA
jgi:cyanophycinase